MWRTPWLAPIFKLKLRSEAAGHRVSVELLKGQTDEPPKVKIKSRGPKVSISTVSVKNGK